MNFDLSVIVPVYGVEKYIQSSVDSILNQTAKNIEIVLVNDCTPDNSIKICEELYGNNERVQIINQPRNMGAGEARNTGIKKARGKYIGFADGDDQIMPDMFETMLKNAEEYDAEVVHATGFLLAIPVEGNIVPVNMLDRSNSLIFSFNVDIQPEHKVLMLDDNLDKRFEGWLIHKYHWSVWNQIYKRDFLLKNDIKFSEMKIAEDQLFALKVLFCAKRFVIVPGAWYVYRPSVSSLSRSGDNFKSVIKSIESQIIGAKSAQESLKDVPFFRDNPKNLRLAIDNILSGLEQGYIKDDYRNLGEEKMINDEDMHGFFVKEFGDKAEYVEFLFYELLRNYPQTQDFVTRMFSDAEVWATIRKNYPEYEKTGDSSVLWDGLKRYYDLSF